MESNEDSAHAPVRWTLLDDRLLRACRVWELRARRYQHPVQKKEGEFYYLNSRDWVVVVARTTAGELLLIEQFRWGSDQLSIELPGGIIDEGEDPVAAGLRELKEETGYTAKSGRLLASCDPNPAILNNRCHIVFADKVELSAEGTAWDEHEEMRLQIVSESEVINWAKSEKIGHALALVGLFYYQLIVKAAE